MVRVRVPLVAVPSVVVPPTRWRDPTDIVLEFEEEEEEEVEEEELEMFDESIDWFEHFRFRPRHHMAGRFTEGWNRTFTHGEQELHPAVLRGANRGRASAADHRSQEEIVEVTRLVTQTALLYVVFPVPQIQYQIPDHSTGAG